MSRLAGAIAAALLAAAAIFGLAALAGETGRADLVENACEARCWFVVF